MKLLDKRLARLEAKCSGAREGDKGRTVELLAAKLARIEEAVVQSGDASDRPGASLIERTVQRYLRGDAGMGEALRDLIERRWP